MYHPHRKPLALLATAIIVLSAAPPALAQAVAESGVTAVSGLPDAVFFRTQMELGVIDRAREWLAAGLPPDFMGDRIGSGLMIAAWEGNIPLMALFAERGANIDQTNALGETALMHAAWKGRLDAVRWLIERGAKVELEGDRPGWTALHYATFAGHGEIVELLLNRGAAINARTPNGSSVLMMAIYEGREDMARWLLARGADPRIKNENDHGALEWAMKFNHPRIARLVATQEEFVVAASRPKADWGPVQKSEPIPKDIEELLSIRGILAARKLAVDKVDLRIAALRAQYARASLKREAPPPAVLEISAERKAPGRQRTRIVTEAGSGAK